jgi:hypothetical protein
MRARTAAGLAAARKASSLLSHEGPWLSSTLYWWVQLGAGSLYLRLNSTRSSSSSHTRRPKGDARAVRSRLAASGESGLMKSGEAGMTWARLISDMYVCMHVCKCMYVCILSNEG